MITDAGELKIINKTGFFTKKSQILRCVGDPTCLKILYMLDKSKEVCPSEFAAGLGLSLPTVSHQLGKLRGMGIVKTVRVGQKVCYSFAPTKEAAFVKNLVKISNI